MIRNHRVDRVVQDLYRNPELRAEFAADRARVLARYDLTTEERAALAEPTIERLGRIGMHPLLQITYSVAADPGLAALIDASDYFNGR